jgi:antagonist of KipI
MGIKVIKAGLLTTVQDLGRYGYRKDGMIVSGAMDTVALRTGNVLLGNPEQEAGIECTLLGPVVLFEAEQLVAVTGGDLSATIDGSPVPMWRPFKVNKGSVLSFGRPVLGCRSYLTVCGGFDLPEILGSYATYLRAGIGGWKGRALKAGDVIPFKKLYSSSDGKFNWSPGQKMYPDYQGKTIRVIKGPEFNLFTEKSIVSFFTEEFKISREADRMGYRLDGPVLQLSAAQEMLSAAVAFGTIQVPGQGTPIVLMADHQTTGGYPRIAQVVSADLTLLAQMKPGDSISFELITLDQAQELLLSAEQRLKQLKQTLTFKYG